MRITVIGSGYVGLVSASCFAEIGHDVISVDIDVDRIAALERGECPIHERWLPELLQRHTGGRLNFSLSPTAAVRNADAVFITVGTPQSESGEADLSSLEAVVSQIAPVIRTPTLLAEKSTVPVCTCDSIRNTLLLKGTPPDCIAVASNPEFLREGTAVTDFLFPDRIVIGVDDPFSASVLHNIYRPITGGSYYRSNGAIPLCSAQPTMPRMIMTSAKSAELIKHASNSFLAMKISYINIVATIAEAVGADIDEICEGIGTDARIGPQFLRPGIGYGGSCFPKDLAAFHAVALQRGISFELLEEVSRINLQQQKRFVRKVRDALWRLRGKRIGVLGLAFKGGTDDIRESPAIAIVQDLLNEGALICAFDPAAMPAAKALLGNSRIEFVEDCYAAATGKDALLMLTDWPEFAELDLQRLHQSMRLPIIVDGRNLYTIEGMRKAGFLYHSVGRPATRDLPVNTVSNEHEHVNPTVLEDVLMSGV